MSSYLALKLGYINKTYTKKNWKLYISILSDYYKAVFSYLNVSRTV